MLRTLLAAATLAGVGYAIYRLERIMTATQQLTDLTSKVDDLIADVRAALATIGQDELSPDAQAALDNLNAKVAAFDSEVGDADGSDTPAEPEPGV